MAHLFLIIPYKNIDKKNTQLRFDRENWPDKKNKNLK